MAISLSNADHNSMDHFLGFVLDAYARNDVSKSEAISVLAHVTTAAAIDNDGEVRAWFRPEQHGRWLEEVRAQRT